MIPCAAMEQPRLTFLYELYKRSEGDAHQGVRLMEDILAHLSHTEPPKQPASIRL